MHFARKKDHQQCTSSLTRASTATMIHITTVMGSYIYSYRKSSAGLPLTLYRNSRPKHTIWTQQEMTRYCGREFGSGLLCVFTWQWLGGGEGEQIIHNFFFFLFVSFDSDGKIQRQARKCGGMREQTRKSVQEGVGEGRKPEWQVVDALTSSRSVHITMC